MWWHVIGPSIIVVILLFFTLHGHQSVSFVFTERINNSGFFNGSNSGLGYWFYVLPLGFLLTQYTQTGYDACAHLSEETQSASKAAARGLWQAIFWSAVGGWILLLLFTFAATNVDFINNVNGDNPYGAGYVVGIFASSLSIASFKIVMVIATIGQFFCAGSGMTSASRMMFAFSRDRAVPGPPALVEGVEEPGADQRDARDGLPLPDRRAAGAEGQRRQRAVRVLRDRLDHGARPVHRLRDPDLPALADGRRLRGRAVDAGQAVQVDVPGRGRPR